VDEPSKKNKKNQEEGVRVLALPKKQEPIGDVGAGAFAGGGEIAFPFSSSHSAAFQFRSPLWLCSTLFYAPKLGLVGQGRRDYWKFGPK